MHNIERDTTVFSGRIDLKRLLFVDWQQFYFDVTVCVCVSRFFEQ